MKKQLIVCIGLLITTLFFPFSMTEAEPLDKGRYIIGFHNEIDLSVLKEPYELHHLHESIHAISVTVQPEAIKNLRKNHQVAWIEKDKPVTISADQIEWGQEAVVKPRTVSMNLTGKGVKIAIIDTGVNQGHPDLSIKSGISVIEDHPSYEDDNGHGTHIAGIIGAKQNGIGVLGVAPDTDLYIVKALDEMGEGTETDFIAGVEWAIKQKVDVINLSITTTGASIATKKILEAAYNEGILIAAATGNDETNGNQPEADILYPARYPTVIGVGSINEELAHSKYSYTGESLEFVAPGEGVYSTYKANERTTNTYIKQSGTSMAVPFVSGVIALYKEAYPQLSMSELRTTLTKNTLNLGVSGKDPIYGYGLIQAPESTFLDLRNHAWYREVAFYLIDQNFIKGFTDQTFRPDQRITRGEVATLVGRGVMQQTKKKGKVFSDVGAEHYAAGYINRLVEEKIITGYPNGTYGPDDFITRADVAVILHRALQTPPGNESVFTDVKDGKYYASAITSLYKEGIVTGYESHRYEPIKQITRAEFSSILAKGLEDHLR